MELPPELQSHICELADNGPATLRPDWRKGSIIIDKLNSNWWWRDFNTARNERDYYAKETWVVWCRDKFIIGPPCCRSFLEEPELDGDYLSMDDVIRHKCPWFKTWPASEDLSWCSGPHKTTLPEWVTDEYKATPNPTLC
jgi:hypothetical protein